MKCLVIKTIVNKTHIKHKHKQRLHLPHRYLRKSYVPNESALCRNNHNSRGTDLQQLHCRWIFPKSHKNVWGVLLGGAKELVSQSSVTKRSKNLYLKKLHLHVPLQFIRAGESNASYHANKNQGSHVRERVTKKAWGRSRAAVFLLPINRTSNRRSGNRNKASHFWISIAIKLQDWDLHAVIGHDYLSREWEFAGSGI